MTFDTEEILEAFVDAAQLRQERKFLWSEGWIVRNHPGGKMLPARVACPNGHDPKLGRRRRDGYFYCVGCERVDRSRREADKPPRPRSFTERSCDTCAGLFTPAASDRRRTCSERCRRRLTSTSRADGRAPMLVAAREMRRQGATLSVIARALGSSAPAICRLLKRGSVA